MSDTPEPDDKARLLAERVHSAYAQQARGPMHPQHEQALLARLAEAIRPGIGSGEKGEGSGLVSAVNAALDAWEEAEPEIRGPRVLKVDVEAATVTLVTD